MTTTRIAYRIGAPCDGDLCYWEVLETADGFGARIEATNTPSLGTGGCFDIDGTPDTLRAIAAALVCIADAQDTVAADG